MFSLIWGFFADLMYWIAFAAMVAGPVILFLSKMVKLLPILGAYALALQVAGIGLTLGGGYYVSDHHGYQRRVAEDQAEIDRLNSEARAKEVELNKKLSVAKAQLSKAKDDIKNKTASINARIDAGELQLPNSCGVQADSSSTSGNGATQSESDRQAIKDIVAIAADGDSAIVSLNSCIARYEQVMQTVNEGVK